MSVTDLPLPDLLSRARAVRDEAHGRRITFSPKVFIPLTMLCRDRVRLLHVRPAARPAWSRPT